MPATVLLIFSLPALFTTGANCPVGRIFQALLCQLAGLLVMMAVRCAFWCVGKTPGENGY
jgi:hypothetical protein